LHKTVQPLLRNGLVKHAPTPDDRRVRRLSLTAAGIALEKQISGMQREIFAAVAEKLGPKVFAGWSAGMVEIARQSRLAFGPGEVEERGVRPSAR